MVGGNAHNAAYAALAAICNVMHSLYIRRYFVPYLLCSCAADYLNANPGDRHSQCRRGHGVRMMQSQCLKKKKKLDIPFSFFAGLVSHYGVRITEYGVCNNSSMVGAWSFESCLRGHDIHNSQLTWVWRNTAEVEKVRERERKNFRVGMR